MSSLWRVFFVFAIAGGVCSSGQADSKPHRRQLVPLNAESLKKTVEALSSVRLPEVVLKFQMTTTTSMRQKQISGKLFSKMLMGQPAIRIELGKMIFLKTAFEERMLTSDGKYCSEETPLHPEHLLCPSDILLPFLSWRRYSYEGTRKVSGRSVHIIRFERDRKLSLLKEILFCPWKRKELFGRLLFSNSICTNADHFSDAVEIAYDPALKTILQVEYFRRDQISTKNMLPVAFRRFRLKNFKKVQGVWLMKSVEITDLCKNVVTKIDFTAAAVGQILSPHWSFNPIFRDHITIHYTAM